MLTNPQEPTTTQVICHVCAGTGHIGIYNHVAGGECFTCNGSGRIDQTAANKDPVVIKQHTRKLTNGYLTFNFWSNDTINVIHQDSDWQWQGIRSVTPKEAREIWTKPYLFRVSSTFFNQ